MRKYLKTMLVLSLAGSLFAGYVSAVKIFAGACALNEPCPYFFGYPACWYGFVMFCAMLAVSLVAMVKSTEGSWPVQANTVISFLGVLFAGSFVVQEVQYILSWLESGYALILPSCVYGFIFYVAMFVLSALQMKKPR